MFTADQYFRQRNLRVEAGWVVAYKGEGRFCGNRKSFGNIKEDKKKRKKKWKKKGQKKKRKKMKRKKMKRNRKTKKRKKKKGSR